MRPLDSGPWPLPSFLCLFFDQTARFDGKTGKSAIPGDARTPGRTIRLLCRAVSGLWHSVGRPAFRLAEPRRE